jgi:hypothetical protein
VIFSKQKSSLSPHDAVVSLLASHSRGLGVRAISRELAISSSTAHRRAQQLKDAGWITTICDLEARYSRSSSQIDHEERLTLDPDRAGLEQYLQWMWIEYGTKSGTYWDLIEELRTGINPSHYRSFEPPSREKPHWPITEAVTPLQGDGFSVPGSMYRRHINAYAALAGWSGRTERAFQSLYQVTKQERYRDFIHLLIHLGEELPSAPGAIDIDPLDCRPQLAELASAADRAARVYWAYAQRVFDAAVISYHRSYRMEELGAAMIREILPAFSDGYYGSGPYEQLSDIEQIRVLDAQLDRGDQEGRALYRHGGGVSRSSVGRGGDGLLAQQLFDQARELIKLRDEILDVPTLTDLLDRAGLKDTVNTIIPDALTAVPLDSEKVRTRIPELWNNEERETEAMEELTVTAEELRVGDIIIGGQERTSTLPLRVDRPLHEGTVLLASEHTAVPIHARPNTEPAITIHRPHHANNQH